MLIDFLLFPLISFHFFYSKHFSSIGRLFPSCISHFFTFLVYFSHSQIISIKNKIMAIDYKHFLLFIKIFPSVVNFSSITEYIFCFLPPYNHSSHSFFLYFCWHLLFHYCPLIFYFLLIFYRFTFSLFGIPFSLSISLILCLLIFLLILFSPYIKFPLNSLSLLLNFPSFSPSPMAYSNSRG